MHARYYNPNMGRFLSVDPVLGDPPRPQSWNRYAYVRDNPIGSNDPTGKATIGITDWRRNPEGCERPCRGVVDATPTMKLPASPSGLPDIWQVDPRHKNPHGKLFRDPDGNVLEWHEGRPGARGWKGKDHWHYRPGGEGGDEHLEEGDDIPVPSSAFQSSDDKWKQRARRSAIAAGVAVIVGTIIEDFLTGGVGVADDPPTVAAGWTLIQSGLSP